MVPGAHLQDDLHVIGLPFERVPPAVGGNSTADQRVAARSGRSGQDPRRDLVVGARRIDATEEDFVAQHHVLVEGVQVDLRADGAAEMPVRAMTPPGAALAPASRTTVPMPVHSMTTSGEMARSRCRAGMVVGAQIPHQVRLWPAIDDVHDVRIEPYWVWQQGSQKSNRSGAGNQSRFGGNGGALQEVQAMDAGLCYDGGRLHKDTEISQRWIDGNGELLDRADTLHWHSHAVA